MAKAVVRVDRRLAPGLRAQFASSFTVLGETGDGRLDVEIGAPKLERIAEQLAGWGALLEVVSPDEVCAELARIGRELVTRYAATA